MQHQHQEPECHAEEKTIICYLEGRGQSKDSCDQNMTLSTISSELFIPWQPNLVWWYIIINQSVFWKKKWITAFNVMVTVKGQNVSVCPDDIFFTAEHFVTKLGSVMYHHEPECMQKDWFAIFKVKVIAYNQNYDSFCYICWTADPFATKLDLMVHCHKSECFMEKWECCVQGQGHSKFQNFNECFSRWYLLNHWTFYYQTC